MVVRVLAEDFVHAEGVIASAYSRNEGSVGTPAFATFEDSSSYPPLGIQLVVLGGPLDFFHLFVEALKQSPQLLEEYNALKRRHEGAEMGRYRRAKDRFVEKVLARARFGEAS